MIYDKSNPTRLFYTKKKAGNLIEKREPVGYITIFFGNKLEDIKASQNSMILYMIGTPPINKDETIMNIAIIP